MHTCRRGLLPSDATPARGTLHTRAPALPHALTEYSWQVRAGENGTPEARHHHTLHQQNQQPRAAQLSGHHKWVSQRAAHRHRRGRATAVLHPSTPSATAVAVGTTVSMDILQWTSFPCELHVLVYIAQRPRSPRRWAFHIRHASLN